MSSDQIRRTGGVRFPLVDSLRAIAALSVFVYHATVEALSKPPIATYTSRLDVGVTLFFVISGFLLYRPFAAAHLREDRRSPELARYAWHRLLRIVPAYWVALTASALLLHSPGVLGSDAIVYYGFGQVYSLHTTLGGIGQAWTLSIEVGFYVFLPFWAWAIVRAGASTPVKRLRLELIALAALAAFSIALKPIFDAAPWTDPQVQFAIGHSVLRFLDQFAIGMALAVGSVWFEDHRPPRVVRALNRRPWISWAVAGAALWFMSTQLGLTPWGLAHKTRTQALEVHYLGAILALGLMLPAVFGNPRRSAIRSILGSRSLLWIGTVSYGLYLWHPLVLAELSRSGIPWDVSRATGLDPFIVWNVVGIVPSLLLAAASWYGIEKTVLRYKGIAAPQWLLRLSHPGRGLRVAPEHAVAIGVSALLAVLFVSGVIGSTGGFTANAASGAAPAGTRSATSWVYVAATYDGRNLTLYQNARPVGSAVSAGQVDSTRAAVEVGNYLGTGRWSGKLGYVALFGAALTTGEIEYHYQAGLADWSTYASAAKATPGELALWHDGALVRAAGGRPAAPRSRFSIEAWVQADQVSNRVVAGQPGAWFLKTDVFGRWVFAVLSRHREIDARSAAAVARAGSRS